MTLPPSGVITSPSISSTPFTPFPAALPPHFWLFSLRKNYLNNQMNWLMWTTIWCLFKLKRNNLVPSIKHWHSRTDSRDHSHMINYNIISHLQRARHQFQIDHMFRQNDLEINLQPSTPFQIYCFCQVLHEIDFTLYYCKWWLACQKSLPYIEKGVRKAN